MKQTFAHPGWGIPIVLLTALAALGSSLVSAALLAPFNTLAEPDHPEFFRLFFGSSLIVGPALWYLVHRSHLHGWRLVGLTWLVYVGSAQLLAHIETVTFNFLFGFTPGQLAYLVGSQALEATFFVPLVVTIAGRWKTGDEARLGPWLPRGASLWRRAAFLSVFWYVPYMVAGYFIADPITHGYYAAKMADLASINLWIPPLQVVRGALWTLLFVLAIGVMNRPLPEAGVIAGLLFGVFHAAGLLLPSPFMPAEMRLAHLPEIVLSLVWQGGLTAAILGWTHPQSRQPKVE